LNIHSLSDLVSANGWQPVYPPERLEENIQAQTEKMRGEPEQLSLKTRILDFQLKA